MYKIYINETPLILLDAANGDPLPAAGADELIVRYTGKAKFLLNYADMLEKTQKYKQVMIYSLDYPKLVDDFESNYKIIEAAGGLVFNEEGKALLIFRRDFWDLPKGKIDKGETKEKAAVREVEEETGLKNIDLGPPLGTTHHTYRTPNGTRILKRTHWFSMKAPDQRLVPQSEEDIERAEWVAIPAFLESKPIIYGSILEIIQKNV